MKKRKRKNRICCTSLSQCRLRLCNRRCGRCLPLMPSTSPLSRMKERGKGFNVIDFLYCSCRQLRLFPTSTSYVVVDAYFESHLKSSHRSLILSRSLSLALVHWEKSERGLILGLNQALNPLLYWIGFG